jgi:CelD/BcsL family acetyltransferase involved in cellulose biosynthesis
LQAFTDSWLEMSAVAAAKSTKAPLSFRLVREEAELREWADAWQALLERSASAEPMLSPAWLLAWWQVYGDGRALHVGLFHDGDQLVGLAPLCKRRFSHRPGIPFQRLEFLGSEVDENDGVCSEYLNVIAQRGREAEVADALARALADGAFGTWQEIVFAAMDGEGAMPALLQAAFDSHGLRAESRTVDAAPFLSLPENWDAFLPTLDKKTRQNLVKPVRDLDRWADADWQIHRVESAADLETGWNILQQLHNQRWQQGSGVEGAFARPRFLAFHRLLLPELLKHGQLELCWLVARGEPVAVHYEIHANGKAYFYQCGRKLDMPSPLRPGAALLSLALQHAVAKGLREYDFLGGMAPYKLQITQTSRSIVELRVARSVPREWLRRCVEWAICNTRSLRKRYRSWRTKR